MPSTITQAQVDLLERIDDMMMSYQPKLYGLIMEHMDEGSKVATEMVVDYNVWPSDKDLKKLWQALMKGIKMGSIGEIKGNK